MCKWNPVTNYIWMFTTYYPSIHVAWYCGTQLTLFVILCLLDCSTSPFCKGSTLTGNTVLTDPFRWKQRQIPSLKVYQVWILETPGRVFTTFTREKTFFDVLFAFYLSAIPIPFQKGTFSKWNNSPNGNRSFPLEKALLSEWVGVCVCVFVCRGEGEGWGVNNFDRVSPSHWMCNKLYTLLIQNYADIYSNLSPWLVFK